MVKNKGKELDILQMGIDMKDNLRMIFVMGKGYIIWRVKVNMKGILRMVILKG